MNTNGLLSFGRPFTVYNVANAGGSSFGTITSPPIIAPFWDDVNIVQGGQIFYRQVFDPLILDQVRLEVLSQYPEVGFFAPSLVFVATWDRVAAFSSNFTGLYNTFQAVIASDGSRSFVGFNYGNIEWGGPDTLIGVSAGDRFFFITHPASLSSSVLNLDGTNVTYRIDGKQSVLLEGVREGNDTNYYSVKLKVLYEIRTLAHAGSCCSVISFESQILNNAY